MKYYLIRFNKNNKTIFLLKSDESHYINSIHKAIMKYRFKYDSIEYITVNNKTELGILYQLSMSKYKPEYNHNYRNVSLEYKEPKWKSLSNNDCENLSNKNKQISNTLLESLGIPTKNEMYSIIRKYSISGKEIQRNIDLLMISVSAFTGDYCHYNNRIEFVTYIYNYPLNKNYSRDIVIRLDDTDIKMTADDNLIILEDSGKIKILTEHSMDMVKKYSKLLIDNFRYISMNHIYPEECYYDINKLMDNVIKHHKKLSDGFKYKLDVLEELSKRTDYSYESIYEFVDMDKYDSNFIDKLFYLAYGENVELTPLYFENSYTYFYSSELKNLVNNYNSISKSINQELNKLDKWRGHVLGVLSQYDNKTIIRE